MDSLLWPVTLPILPTGSSGGTSLSLTSLKSVMVSQSRAGTGGRGVSYCGVRTQKPIEHWRSHLVEQLIARCCFYSSQSVVSRHVLSAHPEQQTVVAAVPGAVPRWMKMKVSLLWGVHQLVAHCPKPQCLGGTEKKRKSRECRNWELALVTLEERRWWC